MFLYKKHTKLKNQLKKSSSSGVTKRNLSTGVHGRFSTLNYLSQRIGESIVFFSDSNVTETESQTAVQVVQEGLWPNVLISTYYKLLA